MLIPMKMCIHIPSHKLCRKEYALTQVEKANKNVYARNVYFQLIKIYKREQKIVHQLKQVQKLASKGWNLLIMALVIYSFEWSIFG